MHALGHAADVQDRDGGVLLLSTLFGQYPFLRKVFADGGYQGPIFEQGVAQFLTQMQVEIVKRSDTAKGFVILPRRWVGSSGHSPGWVAVGALPKISRTGHETHCRSSNSRRSG